MLSVLVVQLASQEIVSLINLLIPPVLVIQAVKMVKFVKIVNVLTRYARPMLIVELEIYVGVEDVEKLLVMILLAVVVKFVIKEFVIKNMMFFVVQPLHKLLGATAQILDQLKHNAQMKLSKLSLRLDIAVLQLQVSI